MQVEYRVRPGEERIPDGHGKKTALFARETLRLLLHLKGLAAGFQSFCSRASSIPVLSGMTSTRVHRVWLRGMALAGMISSLQPSEITAPVQPASSPHRPSCGSVHGKDRSPGGSADPDAGLRCDFPCSTATSVWMINCRGRSAGKAPPKGFSRYQRSALPGWL